MKESINDDRKMRGRPATGTAPLVGVRMTDDFQDAIRGWAKKTAGQSAAGYCHPPTRRARIEGEEMTGKSSAEVPNMRQRTVLQHLSLADWRLADRLPVSAGEVTLSRLLHHGWIESQGEKQRTAVRLTPAGLKAMRSPIGKPFAGLSSWDLR